MGKKRIRSKVVSKGERRSVVAGVREVRLDRSPLDKGMNKTKAWRAGKNPWVTVPGPSSNMRFIRVRANNAWGDPKFATANLFKGRGEE